MLLLSNTTYTVWVWGPEFLWLFRLRAQIGVASVVQCSDTRGSTLAGPVGVYWVCGAVRSWVGVGWS